MKFKKLTKEQIIISLDRLTRFKNTREKYFRVFSDILITNLIEPKLKKQEIESMDFQVISDYVSEIFNESIGTKKINTNAVNLFLKNYENNIFINDSETQKLLNNTINYAELIKLISKDCVVNLLWLKEIGEVLNSEIDTTDFNLYKNLKLLRKSKNLKFPIEKVVLVEGITEEILLPAFAKFLGYDFYSEGIQILPAGGKNKVVKMYYKLANELKIPIFVLLDKDAESNINQINPRLRKQDKIHFVSCGEFEDLLPKKLVIKTVNIHFKNFLTISDYDLDKNLPTAKILEDIFKTQGLHEFKKAEFAKLVKNNIESEQDISEEIRTIVHEIKLLNAILVEK